MSETGSKSQLTGSWEPAFSPKHQFDVDKHHYYESALLSPTLPRQGRAYRVLPPCQPQAIFAAMSITIWPGIYGSDGFPSGGFPSGGFPSGGFPSGGFRLKRVVDMLSQAKRSGGGLVDGLKTRSEQAYTWFHQHSISELSHSGHKQGESHMVYSTVIAVISSLSPDVSGQHPNPESPKREVRRNSTASH
ncbi:hypothetical protein B0T21DRAFT_353164 [Apiosordaria backusii]|uniref:Uncharacterized protein n=1 Tax=Apiosordaria backusii TaxID=314023 RepID=A0AA40DLG8_9PEZI|nr:hypothetical protein B0T21DRAFT_353164 [Apiosordaria backusii]